MDGTTWTRLLSEHSLYSTTREEVSDIVHEGNDSEASQQFSQQFSHQVGSQASFDNLQDIEKPIKNWPSSLKKLAMRNRDKMVVLHSATTDEKHNG
jgi:hypothetical protein